MKKVGIVEGFYWTPSDAVQGRYGEFDPDKRLDLLGFMGRKGLNISKKESAVLSNGNTITWLEYTNELPGLLDIMAHDWADFLGVDPMILRKLLCRDVEKRSIQLQRVEYESVIKKWPSLEPIFERQS